MKLTPRGERVVAWAAVLAFLAILGVAGYIETLGT